MTKKRIIWSAIIVLAIILIITAVSGNETEEAVVAAAKKDLKEEIVATGTVTPGQEVTLAFEKGGRVSAVAVKIGGSVERGMVLATLDRSVELANLDDAKATLLSKEAELAELVRGTRVEKINVTAAKLAKAERTLELARGSIPETIDTAFTKAETAVYQYTESLFSDDRTTAPKFLFSVTDYSAKTAAENGRVTAEKALREIAELKEVVATDPQKATLAELKKTEQLLFTIQNFLIAATTAINSSIISDTDKVTYKTDLATARAGINTGLGNVVDLAESVALAEAEITTAKRELELERAGATVEEVAKAEADVAAARAKVSSAEASLSQKVLHSPISGTVTLLSIEPGEIIGANESVMTVINTNSFEIDVDLPEADIAKIAVGQKALVTLDAYGPSVSFTATVVSIEPAATLVEGIPTYKTTFALDSSDPRIKSGMTANLTVEVSKRANVLSIPERAIRYDEKKRAYVLIKTGSEEPQKSEVTTGLRGTDGDIEILSGLTEGDSVILK